MLNSNTGTCLASFAVMQPSRGPGGGHSLIWPIRGRAAGQGMVFGLLCPEQGIQFYANRQTGSELDLSRVCFFKIVVKNSVLKVVFKNHSIVMVLPIRHFKIV